MSRKVTVKVRCRGSLRAHTSLAKRADVECFEGGLKRITITYIDLAKVTSHRNAPQIDTGTIEITDIHSSVSVQRSVSVRVLSRDGDPNVRVSKGRMSHVEFFQLK